MTIARRVKAHLDEQGVPFETITHNRTATASQTAHAAHIPGDSLAKTVVVHLEDGYVLAVAPSSHRVDLGALQEMLDRRLGLASEDDIARLFDDCDRGAVPPLGVAYDVPTVVDESLRGRETVWFEGGDHRTLVRVAGADFDWLMQDARRGAFCYHA